VTRDLGEARILCDTRAAQCRCFKDAGHVEAGDDLHECDPTRCTGAWTGEYGAGTFMVMRLPLPVTEPRPWDIP
jgi:uncharacterized protein (DUF39 family)